jgi:hypothetical protein
MWNKEVTAAEKAAVLGSSQAFPGEERCHSPGFMKLHLNTQEHVLYLVLVVHGFNSIFSQL